MTVPLSKAEPFVFDTDFGADGRVVAATQWAPTKRAYTPEEVETLVQTARAEALAEVEGQVEFQRAQALAAIAQSLAATGPRLNQIIQQHREQSVELALTMARQLAGVALERMPTGMLEAALDVLGNEIEASSRLLVRAAGLDDDTQASVRRAGADVGFTGTVSFRDDPSMPTATFDLEWNDGRATFDLDEAVGRLREALMSQLAAEAGHTESMTQGGSE